MSVPPGDPDLPSLSIQAGPAGGAFRGQAREMSPGRLGAGEPGEAPGGQLDLAATDGELAGG